MKIYTTLPKHLKPLFNNEIERYRQAFKADQLHQAWEHLEKAHVIGQRYPFAHTLVHWKMLKFGWRLGCRKEILTQCKRLVFCGFKSLFGNIPLGNTGGSDVSSIMTFPVDPIIRAMLMRAGVRP